MALKTYTQMGTGMTNKLDWLLDQPGGNVDRYG
jgi:hypothetical protein